MNLSTAPCMTPTLRKKRARSAAGGGEGHVLPDAEQAQAMETPTPHRAS